MTPTQPAQGTEVEARAKMAVVVEGSQVHWVVRSGSGVLLSDAKLSPEQALHYGRRLIDAAFEAKQ
jgi:hypothetical protein